MVGCYCRVSTQEQAVNGHSIDEQIERTNKYADAVGWKVYKTYTDAGYSGSNTDRPALQMLITDVKKGIIDKVLVYKLDRLSRSQKDTLMLIEDVFLANGCDFVSMSENFDTSSPFGRAMIGILAVFAQLEREQIKERMTMGREARAKQGKYTGSFNSPVGYRYVNGELVTEPYEKMQVVRIYNDYLSGMSFFGIAEKLNAEGFTQHGRRWQYETVRHILQSRLYLGEVSFKQKWYKGTHEPFISEETFNMVQRRIEEKRKAFNMMNRRDGKATSYFGGILYCGQCGCKMSRRTHKLRGKVYNYYCCNSKAYSRMEKKKHIKCNSSHLKMEKVDEVIFNEIRKLRFEPVEIKHETHDDEIEQIKTRITKIDGQIEKLIDLYTIRNVPVDNVQNRISALTEEKEKLTATLADLEEKNNKMPESEIVNLSKELASILPNENTSCEGESNIEKVRAIIEMLIIKVEVLDYENMTIYWNFN